MKNTAHAVNIQMEKKDGTFLVIMQTTHSLTLCACATKYSFVSKALKMIGRRKARQKPSASTLVSEFHTHDGERFSWGYFPEVKYFVLV